MEFTLAVLSRWLVSACPAAGRHARRHADFTTFARAALPPANCGLLSFCYQAGVTGEGR
jgi:hypothetical protein